MLHYDINLSQLIAVADELEASDKQIALALNRALQRTGATLRRMSAKGLAAELQVRALGLLRNRLKSIDLRSNGSLAQNGVSLWYGLKGMPVSWFKGRPRKSADGASFRGHEFDGGFVGRSKVRGRQTIFKRVKSARLPVEEQLMPVYDQAVTYLEDQVFDQVEEIFWQHFRRDLQARVKYGIGEA